MFRTTTIRPNYCSQNVTGMNTSGSSSAIEETVTDNRKRKAEDQGRACEKKNGEPVLYKSKTFPDGCPTPKPFLVPGRAQSCPPGRPGDVFGVKRDRSPQVVLPWRRTIPTTEEAQEERRSNTLLALLQSKKKENLECGEISMYPENIRLAPASVDIQLKVQMVGARGVRKNMEDATLFARLKEGCLLGVFDGHGGSRVANTAKIAFASFFSSSLKETNGNEHMALESMLAQIHKFVVLDPKNRLIGSTAEVSFIRPDGRIFNATVGDSKTFVFRENGEAIPLSLTRDWSHPEEASRAIKLAKTPADVKERKKWIGHPDSKCLRVYNCKGSAINISNALGDPTYLEVAIKPSVTEAQLLPGDKIVMGCDGLWDYVDPKEVRQIILNGTQEENKAKELVNYAIRSKFSQDNVSVIVANVESRQ